MQQPNDYPKRILLAVSGMSPQIVTETVYALAVIQAAPFVPTEIHLITTQSGARQAKLRLLAEGTGQF
ncbi:MAG: CRISPR-associated ring nuclease, partial [Methylomonas sp.]|nr:CRISPR-associated ring nuclease [Methylomonas sp.]